MVEAASRLLAVCGFAEDGLHRIHLRAVPVNVEDAGELTDDGTHDEYVQVHEVARRAARKVFICDVAPSHDSDRAVGDEELVMHPVIEPPEIADRRDVFAGDALSCAAKRIEQAYLHVRERRQAAKHRVAACRVKVVHQQPHSHAAQCARHASCASAGGRCDRLGSGSTGRRVSGGPCGQAGSWHRASRNHPA